MFCFPHRYGQWHFVRELREFALPDKDNNPSGTYRVYIKHCKKCGTPKSKRVRV